MMNYTRRILSLNINSIECNVKRSLLKDFIDFSDVDIVFLQEVCFQNFSNLANFQCIVNLDDNKRGTAILIRAGIVFRDLLMSDCGRIISVAIDDTNFINIYAKSGSQHKKARNDFFMDEISVHLNKRGATNTLIAGDFNCIMDAADTRGTSKNYCFGLRQLTGSFELKDALFHLNTQRCFTFFRGSTASRLDRFYATRGFLEKTVDLVTVPVAFSDHRAIILKFRIEVHQAVYPSGFGYWKINPMILKQTNVRENYYELCREIRQYNVFNANFITWWNKTFKTKTKQFFKNEAKTVNAEIRRQKNLYYNILLDIAQRQNNEENVDAEMTFVKTKLLEIEDKRLECFGLKLKESVLAAEEKVNIFQLARNRSSAMKINSMEFDGTRCEDFPTIKNSIYEHFSTLFRHQQGPDYHHFESLRFLHRQLSQEDVDDLLVPISEEELKKTLYSCTRKKSPGPDGLTYEFYMTCYEQLKDVLLKLYNEYLRRPEGIPAEFSEGVIVLIPKTNSPRTVADFRPISLLNCDYKLFTKILTNRMKKSMATIIDSGQAACIEGQSCVKNMCMLRGLIALAKTNRNVKCALFSLDLEKAFDRVNHQYLWKVLVRFGYPADFINIIKSLYHHAGSKILINGFLTEKIMISRSVRQGCPMSMALFVLFIEPMIRAINHNTSGVIVNNQLMKVFAYADDVNYIVTTDEQSDHISTEITTFMNESHASINISKSSFMRLNQCKIGPQLLREHGNLKILGIKLCSNWKEMVDLNYGDLINKISFSFHQHARRRLNLLQKVWISNSFVLSKLWYVAQVLPAENIHIGKIRKLLGNFLWRGSLYRIERNQLSLKAKHGGLALVNVDLKAKALFMKNLLTMPNDYIYANSAHLGLGRNAKEWSQCAVNFDRPNQITTKVIYDDLIFNLNAVPRVETTYPAVEWKKVWQNLSSNFIPTDWRMTMYRVLNDVIPNNVKLKKHRIPGTSSPNCLECHVLDTNAHRSKRCEFSLLSWEWLKQRFDRNLNLDVDDPEEILTRCSGRNGKAGLWLLLGVVHYNMKNYKAGSIAEMTDGFRKIRWQRKKEVEKIFGNALYCF
jgi:exonuclease III